MASETPFITTPTGVSLHHDEQLKTPERELPSVPLIKQPSPRGFRVRRRTRLRVDTTSISSRTSEIMAGFQEHPIPSIEVIDDQNATPMNIDAPPSQPARRLFTPLQQLAHTLPETPSDRRFNRACTPLQPEILNKAIDRPLSPFSSVSDSSDDSFIDSEDEFSYGGSVTSPESDGTDPFSFESPTKMPTSSQDFMNEFISSPTPCKVNQKKFWTKEMDSHIWAIYMKYLNDPTVTPFKTLPGCPPPVGVCHRVAREARKTWKNGRIFSGPPKVQQLRRDGSPDTIMAKSENLTPTLSPRNLAWPGGGSATRKRLRELCKRKATIIPHYQRMLRSASPYLVENQTRGDPAGSPVTTRNSFTTRDVAASLAASTSTTMRPDGPLAQMARDADHSDWFNAQPQVPWASPASIPSDVETNERVGPSITRLGSPFNGSHTWGPSRTRNQERPRATSLYPASSDTVPRLRSPVHFATVSALRAPSLFHTARTPKRPAQTALEDEDGNVEAEARRSRHDGIFGSSLQNASRRLRLRGMSLGTNLGENMDHVSSEPNTVAGPIVRAPPRANVFSSLPPVGVYATGLDDPFGNPSRTNPAPRLGSPFPGISSRPSRARGRHVPSFSVPVAGAVDLESIDHRMGQHTPPHD